MTHQAEAILNAHLRDPSSTVASVGVCYALCIAARPQFGPAEWVRIHGAIRVRFNPKDDAAWLKLRNRINQRCTIRDQDYMAIIKSTPNTYVLMGRNFSLRPSKAFSNRADTGQTKGSPLIWSQQAEGLVGIGAEVTDVAIDTKQEKAGP